MVEKRISKTDEAWARIFDRYDVLSKVEEDGAFRITAEEIHTVGKREPRLITKFDNSNQLPNLLSANELAILPDTRGSYLIGKFDAYEKYDYETIKPKTIDFPSNIQSVKPNSITSEAVALNVAKLTGMIDEVMETDGDYDISVPTLSGRMGSGNFDYKIKTKDNKMFPLNVTNSQVEVDATYENLEKVAIFEAKNKLPKDFMVRQLYYPYRVYKNIGITKKIVPVFFTYVDNIFSFTMYEFDKDEEYSSIRKIKQKNFILDENLEITIDELKSINEHSVGEDETKTFPQADAFPRVLDMLDHLKTPKNKFDLAEDYEFDDRQGDYYGNALVYLGYAYKNLKNEFELTEHGKTIQSLENSNKRNKMVIEDILNHKLFKNSFNEYFKNGCEFDSDYRGKVSKIILDEAFNVNSEVTAKRRTSTVIQWIKWIVSMAE